MKTGIWSIAIVSVLLVVAIAVVAVLYRNRRDSATRAAATNAGTEEFVRQLKKQGVWIVLEAPPEGPDGLLVLEPEDDKGHYLAIFSSAQEAERFVASGILKGYQWRTKRHDERGFLSLPTLQCDSSFLLDNDFSKSRVILDPNSKRQRVLTADDFARLRRTP